MSVLAAVALAACATAPAGPKLSVAFVDPKWDGSRIPAGMQCATQGGTAATSPALKVSGIPAGTARLVIEFDDESYQPLSYDGGHGKFAVRVQAGQSEVVVPPIPQGITTGLPAGVSMVASNRSPIAPGYLPPCSGGRGNLYSVTVRAVSATNQELARGYHPMGRY